MNARLTTFLLATPGGLMPASELSLAHVPVAAAAGAAAVGLYVLLLRRRKKGALRYANLALVKRRWARLGWRRHVPPALMLLALTLLLIAVARPTAEVSLPSTRATVMLAMDVSGSMRATDVNPSRIEAAQAAAKQYIKDQPKDVRDRHRRLRRHRLPGAKPDHRPHRLDSPPSTVSNCSAAPRWAAASWCRCPACSRSEDFPISQLFSGGFGNGYGGFGFGGGDRFNRFGGRALGDRGPGGPPKKSMSRSSRAPTRMR